MIVKLKIREPEGYHKLSIDGRQIGRIWGIAEVTGREYEGMQQVIVNGSDCFLWVDEIEYVKEGRL